MKNYKTLLNEAVNNSIIRKLTDGEIDILQTCTLKIFKKVTQVCDENGLLIMLGGGSALGSVRHNGFIPWDDDMDLIMPRADYDKLLVLIEQGILGDDYEFTYPNKEHDAPSAFLKIYLKGTKLIGLNGEDSKYPQGIDLDVFPIEGAPSSKISRWWRGKIANTLRLISNVVEESGPWSEDAKKLYSRDWKFYIFMRCRQVIGKMFSVIDHKKWICWYDAFVRMPQIGDFCVIPTGRRLYQGETLPSKVFFPVSKGLFEGMEVNLPADTDAYLKNLYGNYMWIPPVEKRECHLIKNMLIDKNIQH